MKQPVLYQGSLDMLCGVYAITHLIACYKQKSHNDYEDKAQIAFRNVMQSAEDCECLSAKHLTTRGLYDFDLVNIFNNLTPRKRAGRVALTFADKRFRSLENSEKRSCFARGANAIIQEDGGRHWITIDGFHRDEGYHCYDPQAFDRKTQRKRIDWSSGVLIMSPNLLDQI